MTSQSRWLPPAVIKDKFPYRFLVLVFAVSQLPGKTDCRVKYLFLSFALLRVHSESICPYGLRPRLSENFSRCKVSAPRVLRRSPPQSFCDVQRRFKGRQSPPPSPSCFSAPMLGPSVHTDQGPAHPPPSSPQPTGS